MDESSEINNFDIETSDTVTHTLEQDFDESEIRMCVQRRTDNLLSKVQIVFWFRRQFSVRRGETTRIVYDSQKGRHTVTGQNVGEKDLDLFKRWSETHPSRM